MTRTYECRLLASFLDVALAVAMLLFLLWLLLLLLVLLLLSLPYDIAVGEWWFRLHQLILQYR